MPSDKRTLVLDAALKLFVENGFHGTATSVIAKEAGVANGTLFQHFKTKDDLVIALYIGIKEELATHIATSTPKSSKTKTLMEAQFLASLRWSLQHQTKFRFIQLFYSSPYITQVEQAVIQNQVQPHLALIQQGIKEGTLKKLPVDLTYALISGQAFGLYQYLTTNKLSKAKQEAAISTTFEMLWDMLTP